VSQQFNEDLKERDLHKLVDNVFEIDGYASKMGDDEDIVVLSFTVEDKDPATDLVNFVERGYDFVLDADATPGELNDGNYRVFVEIERNRRIGEQIMELLDGVGKLTGIDEFKFRYHKSFESLPVSQEALDEVIPGSGDEYAMRIKEGRIDNFSNFFNRSYLETLSVDQDDLIFNKKYSEPLRMRIKGFGTSKEIYESLQGKIMIETKSMSEVLFLTKYIGNYNITKVGDVFVFENQGHAVVLEKQ
jgi:hypothetical protein